MNAKSIIKALKRPLGIIRMQQSGYTLIEILVGLSLLATAGLAIMAGLSTSYKADITHSVHARADALAKSQMEFVKGMSYSSDTWAYTVNSFGASAWPVPDWWGGDNIPEMDDEYAGFTVNANASDFNADGVPGDDTGIRKIVVSVSHQSMSQAVVVLEDYKMDR